MPRTVRPRVNKSCVAHKYAADNERIVEFGGETTDQGGLISFTIVDGKMRINVYRQGADVEVTVGKPESK